MKVQPLLGTGREAQRSCRRWSDAGCLARLRDPFELTFVTYDADSSPSVLSALESLVR